ncbi:MAG: 16S rRNA (cytosine(967)-C(5))-methyltransferase RsmB [Eubacterium sp.]|nr:16S rRNA (cytosine(967)-C(5))-methyltransferase RsmB [Eubacterium sp.]
MEQEKRQRKNDPRDAAMEILLDMDRTGRITSGALQDGLRKLQFTEKENRAFITRLVEGTTEYRLQLDAVIDQYAKKKTEKQKPPVRVILRMSVYQLLYMDGVPDRAVLSEAGRLMRAHHLENMIGVVNGILRNVQRGLEDGTVDAVRNTSLSLKYSTPEWICDRLIAAYGGEKAERILAAGFTDRPLTIRVNRTKTTKAELTDTFLQAGISVEEGLISPDALRITGVDFVRKLPGFREGHFFVQDESSQYAMNTLGDVAGKRIISLCAAPGGKATMLAERGGIVTARDLTEEKTELIWENAERLGLSLAVEAQDASEAVPEDKEAYDIVIADVPCSGLGVMGRKNDIKYHISPEGVEELVQLSGRILDAAAKAVRPGGTLLFSTCTLLPEENGMQVLEFLEKHREFRKIEEKQLLQGMDPCDGFYYCQMVKE